MLEGGTFFFVLLVAIGILARLVASEDLLFHSDFTGYEDLVANSSSYGNRLSYRTVTEMEWEAMGVEDFAKYKAIVIGDPIETDPKYLNHLESTRFAWTAAITGNIILIGTDPSNHFSDAVDLMSDGFRFAAGGNGTGLYMSLSKYFGTSNAEYLTVLDQIGEFVVGSGNSSDSGECLGSDSVHIVARHPLLKRINDSYLSNWSCSVHEIFYSFPKTGAFVPIAISEDVTIPGTLSFGDGTYGVPYIIGRGKGLIPVGCGNNRLDLGEECDDGNVLDGDGCSSTCKCEYGPPVGLICPSKGSTSVSPTSTSTSTPTDGSISSKDTSGGGSQTGKTVGIAVGGSVAGIILVVFCLILFFRRRKLRHGPFELGGQGISRWLSGRAKVELPVVEKPVEIAGSDTKQPVEMAAANENSKEPAAELDSREVRLTEPAALEEG